MKKYKMPFGPEISTEVIVGAFMVMVLLGLGYFTIILSREAWFAKRYHENVSFHNVMGLREGDGVVVRGMPIGKVSGLSLTNSEVRVALTLDQPVRMRKGYRVRIVSTSILGGRYLEIDEGPKDAPALPQGITYHGEDAYDLMADAAEIVHSVRQSLTAGGVMTNIEQAVADLRMITGRVAAGKGTIGRLLSEDDTLYRDLSETVASLKTLSGRLEKGQGSLGRLLAEDDTLYRDLSATVASLKTVSGRLEKGEGTLGRLLSSDDTLYRNLDETMASVRAIARKIESGEGLLGRLVQDDSLYTEVKAAVQEARETIDDMRETTPVVGFTSVFFGAF